MRCFRRYLRAFRAPTAAFFSFATCFPATAAEPASDRAAPVTPIKHLIVVIGENHAFDNLFGTYKPTKGQTIANLVSAGIVNADGTPGPHFDRAKQYLGFDGDRYQVETPNAWTYPVLPQPYTSDSKGLPVNVPDARFPANMPNGPFQISKYVPYAAYTGNPVHRFFQMWQQVDGGKHDKFVWVEMSAGSGFNGAPVTGDVNTREGANAMGFYNMNPYVDAFGKRHPGDAPFFKELADTYAISDNYHQPVMGGTAANFQALVTGHAAFFTNPVTRDGSPAVPYPNQIENPDPLHGTNNYYQNDGSKSGTYVNCADPHAPGVAAILDVLRKNGVTNSRCEPNHYYFVNNLDVYWHETSGKPQALGPDKYVMPPQSSPTIADLMTKHNVSWKYYASDRGNDPIRFAKAVNGVPLAFHGYCGVCDPLTAYISIMTNKSEEAKLQNYGAFLDDLAAGTLPSVAFVRPFEHLAGHPGDSTTDLYEQFLKQLINAVKSKPKLWADTAILMTTDEGGGYWDSGYVQPLDFFGDGTRIPLIVASPYAKKGFVDHTYYDHVSILKFIERNWRLPPVSPLSRDNLPNPKHDTADHVYKPANGPAIGDLMNLFTFADQVPARP